ncbi:MAG: VanZ family protein [Bacteroidota bacterium]|nr:VanZ family protein [Bacteroidota bacterium]
MKGIKVRSQARVLGYIIMMIYLMFICYFGFFSKIAGRDLAHVNKYNLIPFRTIHNYLNFEKPINSISVVVNIIGNMGVFMPFGIILPIILPARSHAYHIYLVLIGSLLLSLTIELIQYLTSVGVFDVDDLILNSIGALAGYFINMIVRKKYNRTGKEN